MSATRSRWPVSGLIPGNVLWVSMGCALLLAAGANAVPVTTRPLPATAAAAESSPAVQAQRRGLELLAKGDRSGAAQAFKEALKLDAGQVQAMLGLAEVAFQGKQVDEAGRWLGQAVKLRPEDADVQASWGRYLALKGQNKEAEAALRRAAALDPQAQRPRMDLADMLLSRGDAAAAVPLYRQVLAIAPAHAGARYALGQALLQSGDAAAAVAELTQAATLAPANPLPLLALARAETARGRADAALAQVDKALAIQPSLVDALLLKADLLDGKGQADAALQLFTAAAQAAPTLGLPHMRIGMIEQQRGRQDAAVVAYQRAVALDPQQATALNNLAAIATERKQDLKQAEGWAQRAVALNPRAAQFHDTLGGVQRAQGNRQAALKSFQTAARLAPKDPEILFHLGQAWVDTGDKAQARKALQDALALSSSFPGAAQARQLLGSL